MKKHNFLILLAGMLLLTACHNAPEAGKPASATSDQIAQEVKQAYLETYRNYMEYAWGQDDLKPITGSGSNWYDETLYMTAIDALDGLMLMGFDKEADETLEFLRQNISWEKDISVSVFEINIRLLGSLLSSYQLSGEEFLLTAADELGERLLPAFESPTGLPYKYINLKTGETSGAESNPAEIGTLILEFGTLSELTGKEAYLNKTRDALISLFEKRSDLDLPGMVIDVEKGEWKNTSSHIGGMIDSYFEYLYKAWLLFGDSLYLDMYQTHISALNTHLAEEVEGRFWYGRGDMHTGEIKRQTFGALEAFMPGLLALSGDIERAEKLQESCFAMWNLYGLEPEQIRYTDMEVLSPGYYLRPEIAESAFILYMRTGEETYREMGEKIWTDIREKCKVQYGYAEVPDVRNPEVRNDYMHSFFLAETLKYLWLLFEEESLIDLDKYVFNTEAHPLEVIAARAAPLD